MAVSRRGTPTGVVDNDGDDDIVLPVVSGSTTGDMLYAFLGSIGTAPATMATPSGWTKVAERHTAGTTTTTSYIFQKAAAGSEAADYTFTFGSNGKSLGIIVTYSGVDLTAAATPVYAVQGWTDPPRANTALPVDLVAGDWLATYAFGRQSPKTDDPKTWVSDEPGDHEVVDDWTDDSGASKHASHALYDSAGPMPGGSAARTLTVTPALGQIHLWSLRIPTIVESGGGGGGGGGGTWSHVGIPIR